MRTHLVRQGTCNGEHYTQGCLLSQARPPASQRMVFCLGRKNNLCIHTFRNRPLESTLERTKVRERETGERKMGGAGKRGHCCY